MAIIDRLEQLVRDEETPDVYYACGYAWYLHPDRLVRAEIVKRVNELLQDAVALAPQHYLALLYLGHNSYDVGAYSAARRWFGLAKDVAPKTYIGLKSYEMAACCCIIEEGLDASVRVFEDFVNEALSDAYAPEDIWPRELARALERVGRDTVSAPDDRRKLEQLADVLDSCGKLGNWIGSLVRGQPTIGE
jgi:hypothetical protein